MPRAKAEILTLLPIPLGAASFGQPFPRQAAINKAAETGHGVRKPSSPTRRRFAANTRPLPWPVSRTHVPEIGAVNIGARPLFLPLNIFLTAAGMTPPQPVRDTP